MPRDLQAAIRYYQLAADQKNAAACNDLGFCYATGKGAAADAVKFFNLAFDQGYKDAKNRVEELTQAQGKRGAVLL